MSVAFKKLIGAPDETAVGDTPCDSGGQYGTSFVATASGIIKQMHFYTPFTSATATIALYTDNIGYADVLLNKVADIPITSSGWLSANFPDTPVTEGVTYWIIVNQSSYGNWVSSAAGGERYYQAGTAFNNPFGPWDLGPFTDGGMLVTGYGLKAKFFAKKG